MTQNIQPEKNAAITDLRRRAAGELKSGRAAAGLALLEKALGLSPPSAELLNDLGVAYWQGGQPAKAENALLQSIRLKPGWPATHVSLGRILMETGRLDFAEKAFRHALKLDQGATAAWNGLGRVLQKLGRDDESVDCLKRSLALFPKDEETWVHLIGALEKLNRVDEAYQTVQDSKIHFPACPGIIIYEAKLLGRKGKSDEALAVMQKCYDSMQTDAQHNHPFFISFFTELGHLHDRAGNADQAFFFYEKKNKIRALDPKVRAMDKARVAKEITCIRERFTAEHGLKPGAPAMGKAAPAFLVGFPRSGTTLLEQILASHPDACAGEELPAVDRIAQKLRRETPEETLKTLTLPTSSGMSFPSCLLEFGVADIEGLREAFWAEHGGRPADKLLVDKLPMNLLHAGLIKRVFPDSKFILALRHPCDCVLSCFMQTFVINPAMVRFLDIEDAARFYDETFSLWEYYREVLDLNVHTIRYEDTVSDFEPTIAALLEFLGLEWNDAVLEYDKNARERKERIRTPSYTQVSQKIYTRASGRWLKYRKHLEPVLPILEPWVLKHGYSLEAPDAGD